MIKINELICSSIKEDRSSNQKQKTTHDIVSHQFRKFFQSYPWLLAKCQNWDTFQTPFKR